jgi:hypothetical protein
MGKHQHFYLSGPNNDQLGRKNGHKTPCLSDFFLYMHILVLKYWIELKSIKFFIDKQTDLIL